MWGRDMCKSELWAVLVPGSCESWLPAKKKGRMLGAWGLACSTAQGAGLHRASLTLAL